MAPLPVALLLWGGDLKKARRVFFFLLAAGAAGINLVQTEVELCLDYVEHSPKHSTTKSIQRCCT